MGSYFYGNGHYYEYYSGSLTWEEANSSAKGKTWNGLNGYLPDIYESAENELHEKNNGEQRGALSHGWKTNGLFFILRLHLWAYDDVSSSPLISRSM